jgi:hypothetical protein
MSEQKKNPGNQDRAKAPPKGGILESVRQKMAYALRGV